MLQTAIGSQQPTPSRAIGQYTHQSFQGSCFPVNICGSRTSCKALAQLHIFPGSHGPQERHLRWLKQLSGQHQAIVHLCLQGVQRYRMMHRGVSSETLAHHSLQDKQATQLGKRCLCMWSNILVCFTEWCAAECRLHRFGECCLLGAGLAGLHGLA